MTAGSNVSWPGITSTLLMLALAFFLFEWNGSDAVPRPPADRQSPRTASTDSVARPAPITLPPPPQFAPEAPVEEFVAAPLEPQPAPEPRADRVLLRQLEAGDGPAIEIAWPSSGRDREKLYAVFIRCYGMALAILDREGRLFRASDPPGRSWVLNRDRYSGFVRQVSGQRGAAEKQVLARIRAHHKISTGMPVRLFPRSVDAALLGGLRRLADTRYEAGTAIRAHYGLSGATVWVTDITIETRAIPGTIILHPDCRR